MSVYFRKLGDLSDFARLSSIMLNRTNLVRKIREVLAQKLFTEKQIDKVIPRLSDDYIRDPTHLIQVINTWNTLMGRSSPSFIEFGMDYSPPLAVPPASALLGKIEVDMNVVLADIEPDLLLLDPEKLVSRHKKIQGLGLTKNLGEEWLLLFNAPRGFYLQDWVELSKKIYYTEHKLIDFLFDKKEQKAMDVHPIVKSAAISEIDFDHIRTRYLFALRCGYAALSHLYSVQMALDRPTLRDLVLADNRSYLDKFAPFCSEEEYNSFSNMIKNTEVDEDDAEIFERLADLNALH